MHRHLLLQQLGEYENSAHISQHERNILTQFIDFINNNKNCFERENKGHVTGSAWIVRANKHALLTHHRKLNIWIQVGGHADGESDIAAVALREAHEETGISNLSFLTPSIFDIDIHPIPSSCEFHYDIRYLLIAPEGGEYQVSEESHDLAWISCDDIVEDRYQQSVVRMNKKFVRHFMSEKGR